MEKIKGHLRAKRDLRFALLLDTFRLVSSFLTADDIWERLKELYSGDSGQTHFIQTTLLSEFGSFKQKAIKTIDLLGRRFTH